MKLNILAALAITWTLGVYLLEPADAVYGQHFYCKNRQDGPYLPCMAYFWR